MPSLPPTEATPTSTDDGVVTVETSEDVLEDELIVVEDQSQPAAISIPSEDQAIRQPSPAGMKILSKLDETLGITIEDAGDFPEEILQNVATVLLGGKWITNDDAMRQVIIVVLNALDPAVYTPDGEWRMGEFAALRNVFLTELSRRPKLASVSEKIQTSLQRPKPPRLPRT